MQVEVNSQQAVFTSTSTTQHLAAGRSLWKSRTEAPAAGEIWLEMVVGSLRVAGKIAATFLGFRGIS